MKAVLRLGFISALFFGTCVGLAHELTSVPMLENVQAAGQRWPVGDTVNVCAIRIDFVPDSLDGTSGDGTMGSAFSDSLIIDPLPHDKVYFKDHLAFLEHYYRTVSKGRLPFGRLDVYPEASDNVYRVAHPMWHYNYNLNDDILNQRLAEFFVEALQLADADVNFADYDAVIIFHAGVGKDFNIGYDDTPFDLPSAFITPADFQTYLPDYANGFQTNDGVMVHQGLILPEGESQAGFELGLNGIMIKLFGNWIGLPDLFDTQRGRSGIGRWGMMDQGSGNVFGLVPACPEAWSRVYMGWEEPTIVWANTELETLQVKRFDGAEASPEILLLPITETEYYLIENRSDDPDERGYVACFDRQGTRMQITLDGEITIFGSDFGVMTEADNYDFGIPGAGLLIWHIDEAKIQEGLADNSVNVDPKHRGVDLVEADAAQDIGEEYGFGFSGGGTELGAPEDAWWDENDYHKQANGDVLYVKFANTTFPAARTHDGAYSWYELSDFSPIQAVMSFSIINRSRAPGFPIELTFLSDDSPNIFPGDFNGDGASELILTGQDSTVYIIDSTAIARPLELPVWDNLRVVDIDGDEQDELLLGADRFYILRNLMEEPFLIPSHRALRQAVYNHLCAGTAPDNSIRILALHESINRGSSSAMTLFDGAASLINTIDFPDDTIWHVSNIVALEPPPSHLWAIGYEADGHDNLLIAVALSDEISILWQREGVDLRPLACIATEADTLLWCEQGWLNRFTGATINDIICSFHHQILDWDGDGAPEIISETGACHLQSGFPVEGFPLRHPLQNIMTADFDGDGQPGLFGDDGNWRYYRHSFYEPSGFPMAKLGDYRFIFHWETNESIEIPTLFSPDYFSNGTQWLDLRHIIAGGAPSERKIFGAYPDVTYDPNPTNFHMIEPGEGAAVYARSDWVYPWPNPTNDVSQIRVTLPYSARIHVRLFDIAGHLVDELTANSSGAGPFDLPWDVSNVASGVYIGIVEVEAGGKTERAQIRIAVTK